MKISRNLDWIDWLNLAAVLMVVLAAWACSPLIEINRNKPPQQPTQSEPSCEDCHGDFHRLTPLKSGSAQ